MTSTCATCLSPGGACQCVSCAVCGGIMFADEAQQVHRCWAHSELVPDALILSGYSRFLPSSPRPRHTAVLLTPEPQTHRVVTNDRHDWTPSTRSLR